MENSPSNPVAPTTFFVPFRNDSGAEPVALPVAPTVDRAAEAMMAAAKALLAVAHALQSTVPKSTGSNSEHFCAVTVTECTNEFLVAKARAGRSSRYLRQVRVSLSSFARARPAVPICEVTLSDVEKWVFSRGWKVRTMRGYLADVRTLFNFALRRGYVKASPAAGIDLPPDESQGAAPGISTPAEVAKLLHTARGLSLDVMRHLALRYFVGVRSAEAHRLREENILLDRGYVEIPAVKAKTRRRRLVKISPALGAWLALGGTLRAMHPSTVRAVVRAAGVPFPKNATRHSFCSYHLAKWRKASDTALDAGHSEAMLFAHYRELVTEADATQFWALTPDAAAALCATP